MASLVWFDPTCQWIDITEEELLGKKHFISGYTVPVYMNLLKPRTMPNRACND